MKPSLFDFECNMKVTALSISLCTNVFYHGSFPHAYAIRRGICPISIIAYCNVHVCELDANNLIVDYIGSYLNLNVGEFGTWFCDWCWRVCVCVCVCAEVIPLGRMTNG